MWFKEGAHTQKIVSSNPSAGSGWTFFTLSCIVFLKRPKINLKKAEDGPFKKPFLQILRPNGRKLRSFPNFCQSLAVNYGSVVDVVKLF